MLANKIGSFIQRSKRARLKSVSQPNEIEIWFEF